jgi:hypothetical protein
MHDTQAQLWVDGNIIYGGWMDAPQTIARYYPEENYIEFITDSVREPMTRLPTKQECLDAVERQELAEERNRRGVDQIARAFERMDEEADEAGEWEPRRKHRAKFGNEWDNQ